MSNALKLQKRLLLNPKDFTWDELTKVLASFGYTELKTGKTGVREENLWTTTKKSSIYTNRIQPIF